MRESEIRVEVSYTVGLVNQINGNFQLDASSEHYFKRDLEHLNGFLGQALKNGENHYHIMVTVSVFNEGTEDKASYMDASLRFILRDYDNGYEERKYVMDPSRGFGGYNEVPIKSFGTEGNARREMKKAVIKSIKQFQKEYEEQREQSIDRNIIKV